MTPKLPRHAVGRLQRWHRRSIHGATLALFATGALWLVFEYWVKSDGDFGATHHPLQTWWLKLHGAAALVMIYLAGTVLLTHMRHAWRVGRNRLPGAAFSVVFAALTVTGYLLYYAGGESARALVSAAHWIIGASMPIFLWLHISLGRAGNESTAPRQKSAQPLTSVADDALPRPPNARAGN